MDFSLLGGLRFDIFEINNLLMHRRAQGNTSPLPRDEVEKYSSKKDSSEIDIPFIPRFEVPQIESDKDLR